MIPTPADSTLRAGFTSDDAGHTLEYVAGHALPEDPDLDFIPDDPVELRSAVADMAARINLADWRFVKLIAAMDRRRGWAEGGYCSLGNWLDHRCGLGPCASRERIRVGRALARLPRIDAAFRDGILSYSKVRAITRVATPDTEAVLLALAGRSSAAQLESLVRTYERVDRSDGQRIPCEERRALNWHYEDGMLVITAAVPAARGALVIKALQKVVDARLDERDACWQSLLAACPGAVAAGDAIPAAAELADAELVDDEPGSAEPVDAEPVSAQPVAGPSQSDPDPNRETNGSGPVANNEPVAVADDLRGVSAGTRRPTADRAVDVPAEADDLPASLVFELSSHEQRHADALVDLAENYLATGPGRRRRRSGQGYEVVLTISRNELAGRPPTGGVRFHVDPDWGVDEEDARRIACDADLTEFIQDPRGNLLNYERRRRIVPAALMRALKLRDHDRCRFPGCAHRRHVEAHHVRHWINGGETRLENLVLLCSAHHRLLHHGAFHITVEDGDVVFADRHGEVIEPALSPQFAQVPAGVSGVVSGETGVPGRGSSAAGNFDVMAAIRDCRASSFLRDGILA